MLRRPPRRAVVRALALALYAGLLAKIVLALHGLPAARDLLVPLLLGGFLIASVSSVRTLRSFVVRVAVDWAPFVLGLWAYDLIRGYADGTWLPAHAVPQLRIDRLFGLGSVPTVWLQQRLWHGGSHLEPYDYLVWLTYMSYFFGTTAVLAVLWWRSRALFRRFAAMVVALAFAGCATYVLYPAVPPWLAAQEGLLPPVERLIWTVNAHVPLITLQPLWERGNEYANEVAAVPSLHAAYTLLIVLFLVPRLRTRLRHLLWLYPLAMAFTLVYSGEHYLTDILLGWAYALAVYRGTERLAAALAERRLRTSSGEPQLARSRAL